MKGQPNLNARVGAASLAVITNGVSGCDNVKRRVDARPPLAYTPAGI
jgi:hypothetical protein